MQFWVNKYRYQQSTNRLLQCEWFNLRAVTLEKNYREINHLKINWVPVPGAPYSKIPAWFRNGEFPKISGYFVGQIRTSSKTLTADSRPANKFTLCIESIPPDSLRLRLFLIPCKQYAFVVFSDSTSTSFVRTGLLLSENQFFQITATCNYSFTDIMILARISTYITNTNGSRIVNGYGTNFY